MGSLSRVWTGPATRIYLAAGVTDMRTGFEGLYGLVRDHLLCEPLSGHLFLFNGQRNLLTVLVWDRSGLWVCAKRLEKGRFNRKKASKTEASRTLELHIGIDPKQLLLQDSGDHRKGSVDLFFLQRDVSGKTVAADKQHIDLNLEAKQHEYLAKVAMVLDRHLTVAPQSAEIRVVLRDTGSGLLGSVTLPTTAFLPNATNAVTPAKESN
ncbi:MAG: IS66 family insertion sequence element accessory protein TnpB [Candidatus Sulfotelmatobacter sp.]